MLLSRRTMTRALLATPFVWPATRLWANDAARLRLEGEDVMRRIAGLSNQPFAASEEEMILIFSGVVDLAVAKTPSEAPEARTLGYLEVILDVVAATATGELSGMVADGGDIGGLEGASVRLDGHMIAPKAGAFGLWLETRPQSVGRPTQATRVGIKANLALHGQSSPRAAFGPVAGTFSMGGSGQKALFGAAALSEVSS